MNRKTEHTRWTEKTWQTSIDKTIKWEKDKVRVDRQSKSRDEMNMKKMKNWDIEDSPANIDSRESREINKKKPGQTRWTECQ